MDQTQKTAKEYQKAKNEMCRQVNDAQEYRTYEEKYKKVYIDDDKQEKKQENNAAENNVRKVRYEENDAEKQTDHEIDQHILHYIEKRRLQGMTENTLLAYRRDLQQFAEYLRQRNLDWHTVTSPQLCEYLRHLENEKKRPATVQRAAASLKAFFRDRAQSGEIRVNPAEQMKIPRAEKEAPHILTPEETALLLQQPKGMSPKAVRDRAMLELLYATGIRVSELLQIELADVSLSMEYVLCRQGGMERVVPFGRTAKKSLQEYLDQARPQLVKDPECSLLFTNLAGQKMSRQGFWKLIRQYAQDAGIEGEVTPHTIRHSFAAHLVNNGADLYAVQELMGYADLSAAQVYAKMHRVSVREVYTKTHPRE